MHAYNKKYINRLKELILSRFGDKEILSSDCYRLSVEIDRRVGMSISETTLKRFFGFTSATHHPSQYTLNALAIFCGFSSWENFRQYEDQSAAAASDNKSWGELRAHLSKITYFQLATLKKRNPGWGGKLFFRDWIPAYLREFEKDDRNLSIFHAPAGYGKTSALGAWLDKELEGSVENSYLYVDNLSLFLSSVYGYSPMKWLAAIFELSTPDLDHFFQQYEPDRTAPGFLHIVIDGFNEEHVSTKQYYAIVSNLLAMIDHLQTYPWLKFTLVMRTHIYEKTKKYCPAPIDYFTVRAQLQFSIAELSMLMERHNIPHTIADLAASSNLEWLRTPKFFDSFYRLRKNFPTVDFRQDELKFFIIRDVIENNLTLLNALQNTPRAHLVRILRELLLSDRTVTERGETSINRRKVNLPQTELVEELVAKGMVIPVSRTDGNPDHHVFRSPYEPAYLYAHYCYYTLGIQNMRSFASQCVKVDLRYTPVTARLSMLWFAFFQTENLDLSFLDGKPEEPNPWCPTATDLLAFTASVVNYLFHLGGQQYAQEVQYLLSKKQIHRKIFQRTQMPYRRLTQIFQALLPICQDREQEFRYRFILALLALFKWDERAFITQLEHLVVLQDTLAGQLSVDPAEGLSLAYQFFKYGKTDTEALRSVFAQNFNLRTASSVEEDYCCEMLAYTLLLTNPDPVAASHYLKTIEAKLRHTRSSKGTDRTVYTLLYQILQSIAYGKFDEAADNLENTPLRAPLPEATPDGAHPSHISLFIQILRLHRDLASGMLNDRALEREIISRLKKELTPLGYPALAKHAVAIKYARNRFRNTHQD